MKRLTTLLPLLCALLLPLPARAQTPPPESDTYGAYPENYQEIITAWLDSSLVDPKSARVKWLTTPKQGALTIQGREVRGYLVEFSVNVRNVFGAYTGNQKHTALLRDGKLVTATGFVYH